METKCSFHRVTKLLHSTFTKNDHILVTSPRTTIFWGSSLLSKNDHILDTSPSSSTPSSFKICLDPAKDSWWLKSSSTHLNKWESTWPISLIYLAIFTYLPGRFYLSTWPFFVSTWPHPPRIRPQLHSYTAHSSQKDGQPLQYNTSTWTCRT